MNPLHTMSFWCQERTLAVAPGKADARHDHIVEQLLTIHLFINTTHRMYHDTRWCLTLCTLSTDNHHHRHINHRNQMETPLQRCLYNLRGAEFVARSAHRSGPSSEVNQSPSLVIDFTQAVLQALRSDDAREAALDRSPRAK